MYRAGFTTLYRAFNQSNELLYIGISCSVMNRMQGHKGQSCWFKEMTTLKTEHYDTREEALTAESKAIKEEKPRYNVQGRAKKQKDIEKNYDRIIYENDDRSELTKLYHLYFIENKGDNKIIKDMDSLIMLIQKGQRSFFDAVRNKRLTPQMRKIAKKMWIKNKNINGHNFYDFMRNPLDYYEPDNMSFIESIRNTFIFNRVGST